MTLTPVLVVTGFPGVGKTTLLRRWFDQRPSQARWALLHVEPGVQRIDAEGDVVGVAEVAGGCACCAADVGFRTALAKLLRQGPWDLLVVEASALGHPARVVDRLRAAPFADLLSVLPPVAVVDPRRAAPFIDPAHSGHVAAVAQVELARMLVLAPDIVPAVAASGGADGADGAGGAGGADGAVADAIAALSPWPPSILPADAGCPISAPETWPLAVESHRSVADGRMIELHRLRWQWPADRIFDRRTLERALQGLAGADAAGSLRAHGLLRMDGVFRTARTWYRWQATEATTRWEETSWRIDNRLEAIAIRRFDPQVVIEALQGAS
jgi:hypothetical protein